MVARNNPSASLRSAPPFTQGRLCPLRRGRADVIIDPYKRKGKTGAVMQKIKDLINKYYEGLAYLFFGGLATLLNLVVFAVFQAALGTAFATGIGNVLDNVICILFAYWTNRTFVFKSQNTGKAAWAEFGQFVSCRIATMVMDQVIIWVGVSLLGPHVGFAVANAKLWAMGVKLFSQVIVILSNYIFSKVLIFKKK